jgi:hypothetical protein
MRQTSKLKSLFTQNKGAVIIGILIGGVWTRFLEDSNLLVNGVLTGITTAATLVAWRVLKKVRSFL